MVFNGKDRSVNQPDGKRNKPRVNIIESRDEFRIELAVPGFDKSEISLEIENDELKISGNRKNEPSEGETYLKNEFNTTEFERTFSIPGTVNKDAIKAKYNNGILLVLVPKKEEFKVKPSREISVN